MIRRLFIAQARHAQEWPDVPKPGTWILYDPDKQVARALPDTIRFNYIARRRTALRTVPYSRGPAVSVSHDPFSDVFKDIQSVINKSAGRARRSTPYAHTQGPELLVFIHDFGPATYFSGCDSAKQALDKINLNPKAVFEGKVTSSYNTFFHSQWFNPVFKTTDFDWDRRQRFTQEIAEFQAGRGWTEAPDDRVNQYAYQVARACELASSVEITTDLPPLTDAQLGRFVREQIERERVKTRSTGKNRRLRGSLDDLVTRSLR